MNKKIVDLIFIANCLLLILISYTLFSELSYGSVTKDYSELTISSDKELNPADYCSFLSETSKAISSDIFIRIYNNHLNCLDYYRTTLEDYFKLGPVKYKWNAESTYSSYRFNSEKKLYGLFTDTPVRILPIENLSDLNDSVSISVFVPNEHINQFALLCSEHQINCSKNNYVNIVSYHNKWITISSIFILFLLISVVFYSFSCKKDTIIKKSLGYSTFKIVLIQLKACLKKFLLISFLMLIVSIVVFTFKEDFISSILFNILILVLFVALIIACVIFFAISFIYIAYSSKISDIKGKSNKKDLLFITEFFRVLILFILLFNISSINLFNAISEIKQLKISEKQYQEYLTFKAHNLREYDLKYEEYEGKLLNAYNEFHNEGLLLVTRPSETLSNNKKITVNDNYIDFCDNLIDTSGNRITSANLKKGKMNYLLPEKTDTSAFLEGNTDLFGPEDINIIYYRSTSNFDLLSNSQDGKRIDNVILEVTDPNVFLSLGIDRIVYEILTAYFSNSVFMKCDINFDEPYDQILPILKKYDLNGLVFRAPLVSNEIDQKILNTKQYLIYTIFTSFLYLFAFIVLMIFSVSLYCSCYLQDISVKLINGHSVLHIISYVLIRNLSLIPVFLIVVNFSRFGRYFEIGNSVIITGIIAETLMYYILVKYKSKKNLNSLIKGA